MEIEKFKRFCELEKLKDEHVFENIENIRVFKKGKPFLITILLLISIVFILLSPFLIGNDTRVIAVFALIMALTCFLELTIKLNGKVEFKSLFYTLFNFRKVLKQSKEENKEKHNNEIERTELRKELLNESSLGYIYSNKIELDEYQLTVFHNLYKELPNEDIEIQIEKRLSINNSNNMSNF